MGICSYPREAEASINLTTYSPQSIHEAMKEEFPGLPGDRPNPMMAVFRHGGFDVLGSTQAASDESLDRTTASC